MFTSNQFHFHEYQTAGDAHFDMNGFVQTLALTQKQKTAWEWPFDLRFYFAGNRKEHFPHVVRTPDLVSVGGKHARQ